MEHAAEEEIPAQGKLKTQERGRAGDATCPMVGVVPEKLLFPIKPCS